MSHKQRGMTLLEVLVALAIFATAAISLIRSVSQHINTLNQLEDKIFSSMVIDNQMALVMLNAESISAKAGTQELANRTWYWKVEPISTANNLLSAVDVSVSIDQKSTPVLTVRSYVSQ